MSLIKKLTLDDLSDFCNTELCMCVIGKGIKANNRRWLSDKHDLMCIIEDISRRYEITIRCFKNEVCGTRVWRVTIEGSVNDKKRGTTFGDVDIHKAVIGAWWQFYNINSYLEIV